MTPNDRDFLSDDVLDLLIDLVGQAAYERIDPMDPRHARFFEWLARDARLRLTAAERRELDREATRFADRILRRRAAERDGERHHVRCVNEAPPMYPIREDERDAEALVAGNGRRPLWWDLAVAAGAGRELWDEPPVARVGLPNDVEDGRYVALSVAGDSMAPLLHTGDTILVKLGSEPVPGHIVVARHPEHAYVVKCVGRVTSMRVELVSLNADYAPLEIPNDSSLVLGTVVLRWCQHERGRLRP